MEKFKPTNIKGAVDTLPEVQSLRNRVTDTLRKYFEAYGYAPIETASVNYLEILKHKYEDGAEIVREIYKIKDQGDRDLGLRFDLTVPFAKFIASNRNIKMPFRRYEIGKVWRNGPVKAGRLREFYQCDIDVVGTGGQAVEAEMIALAVHAYREIGINPVIKYGNRKLLYALIEMAGIEKSNADKVISVIDKMEKITRDELIAELVKLTSKGSAEKLLELMIIAKTDGQDGAKPKFKNDEILKLEKALGDFGVADACEFTPNLARGLNIYTGTVWEIFDRNGGISSSLGGGGRYDDIITNWVDNGLSYPAVGMSFGLEPIMAVLKAQEAENSLGLKLIYERVVDIMIVSMNEDKAANELATKLRGQINMWGQPNKVLVMYDMKVGKAFEYADKTGVGAVCVIGSKEVASGEIKLRNMQSGQEEILQLADLII